MLSARDLRSLKTFKLFSIGTRASPVSVLAIVAIFVTFSAPIMMFLAKPLKATKPVTPKSTNPPTPGISPKTDITKSTPVLANVLPDEIASCFPKSRARSLISTTGSAMASINSAVSFPKASPDS